VTVRLARADDAGAVAAIYAPNVAAAAISFELDPPDAAEMQRRIAATVPSLPWLVAEEEGAVVGFAYASKHRERAAYQWSVDVSVYVDARRHRRGLGRALYRPLLAIVRAQGFYAAHAGITLPNHASVGLHESLGFRPVGVYRAVGYKLGAWHDVGWWQLPLRERTGQPALPRSLSELQRDPEWNLLLAR
jgi:L-amino acid N-acyltransferase YncA